MRTERHLQRASSRCSKRSKETLSVSEGKGGYAGCRGYSCSIFQVHVVAKSRERAAAVVAGEELGSDVVRQARSPNEKI